MHPTPSQVAENGTVPDLAPSRRMPAVPTVDDGIAARLIAAFGLTHREAEGMSKAAIADALVLSENTVRGYAKNAYAKMGVHSKKELQQALRELS